MKVSSELIPIGKISMIAKHGDFSALISEVEVEFGVEVLKVAELGGEVDLNLRAQCTDGRALFIKCTRVQTGIDISWQWRLLEHMALHDARIPVPRVLRTLSGEPEITATHCGSVLQVRVMTWLDGGVIGRADRVDFQLLSEVGTIAGNMFNSLQSVDRSGIPTTHHWDVRHQRDAIGWGIDFVKDPANLIAIEAILKKCEPVEPYLARLPTGLVHQDLNDFNVLVDQSPDERFRVTGIIDFGDALDTVRVAEVVVAGAYAMLRQQDPLGALSAVVAGFNSVVPLTEMEIAVIFPLASARLCLNACTWTKRTAIDPRPYGVSRMLHTWPAIHFVAPLRAEQALSCIKIACKILG